MALCTGDGHLESPSNKSRCLKSHADRKHHVGESPCSGRRTSNLEIWECGGVVLQPLQAPPLDFRLCSSKSFGEAAAARTCGFLQRAVPELLELTLKVKVKSLNPVRLPWTVAYQALCLWDFPGKSTGVGCHFLLQGIFLTQGSNPGLPHSRQML